MRLGVRLIVIGLFLPIVLWLAFGDGYNPRGGAIWSLQNDMRLVFGHVQRSRSESRFAKYNTREIGLPFRWVLAASVSVLALGAYRVLLSLRAPSAGGGGSARTRHPDGRGDPQDRQWKRM